VSKVKFVTNQVDAEKIRSIADRAVGLMRVHGEYLDLLSVTMDLSACHANGCPLQLTELLNADDFNLLHDVLGIRSHIDRKTGKITKFLPRFSKSKLTVADQ
jgi:hypothetical protein